jgi:thioredoxin reductase (NADPH)
MAHFDCLVVGGGPAGLTAGMYASRAGFKTGLLEGMFPGGQIVTTPMMENYPGFPNGITGADFGTLIEQQCTRFGLEVIYEQAESMQLQDEVKIIKTSSGEHTARAVILCMGAKPTPLFLPREFEMVGRGVSYCATCDGAFFKGKKVAVVGGGDTACEEAAYLARLCEKVYLIHRRSEFRAAAVVSQRVKTSDRIELLLDTVVEGILGETEVSGIKLKNTKTNAESQIDISGFFIAIGVHPRSECAKGQVEMTDYGYIKTDSHMRTNMGGVFAAGDVRDTYLRQVVTASADGAIAATAAGEYLTRT